MDAMTFAHAVDVALVSDIGAIPPPVRRHIKDRCYSIFYGEPLLYKDITQVEIHRMVDNVDEEAADLFTKYKKLHQLLEDVYA